MNATVEQVAVGDCDLISERLARTTMTPHWLRFSKVGVEAGPARVESRTVTSPVALCAEAFAQTRHHGSDVIDEGTPSASMKQSEPEGIEQHAVIGHQSRGGVAGLRSTTELLRRGPLPTVAAAFANFLHRHECCGVQKKKPSMCTDRPVCRDQPRLELRGVTR